MNVASLSLCKELYELSECTWDGTDQRYNGNELFTFLDKGQSVVSQVPAYDLGFILRKLPERTNDIRDTVMLGRATNNKGWSIVYRDMVCIADTPENAACSLAIKLFQQNILQRSTHDAA